MRHVKSKEIQTYDTCLKLTKNADFTLVRSSEISVRLTDDLSRKLKKHN